MTHRCIDESELDRLLDLAGDHPDRKEANSCVRCRTLLAQYAAFKSGHIPGEARYEEAEPALERFKESLLSDPADPARRKPPVRSTPLSFRSILRGTRLRLAWGTFAAVVIVFIAVITWAPWSEREIILRSESPASQPRSELPELWMEDGGSIELYWPRVREADAYRVTVYTTEFEQLFSETTVDTFYLLERADLPGDARSGDMLQWRIESLRMGEAVERSELGIIRLR